MTDVDDWRLADQAARGDLNAFARLVRRYQQPVISFSFRMTGSSAEAEDVAQETFIRLHRALKRATPRAAFATFVFHIARNAAMNYLRGRRRHERKLAAYAHEQETMPGAVSASSSAEAHEAAVLVESALAALPLEYREALVLRECQGLDYRQIAAILDIPVGTVRSRIARGRERLRQHLLSSGGDVL